MMKLVWFRRDLRIEDNPALFKACEEKKGVLALHIATPKTWARHHMGLRQQQWLDENLLSLEKDLRSLNVPLLRLQTSFFSECPALILDLCKKHSVDSLYYNLEYEWDERRRDQRVFKALSNEGIKIQTFDDQCLNAPTSILNQQGKPYSVFTPYKRRSLALLEKEPDRLFTFPLPKQQPGPLIKLSKKPADTSSQTLKPSHQVAKQRLQHFLAEDSNTYHQSRDLPALAGTSNLSAYLALGVLSARQCINELLDYYETDALADLEILKGPATWVSELIWRDFYKMVCFQYPWVSRGQPFKKQTNLLRWQQNEAYLLAWQQGQTGVPIVDAAMRQLNQTGWMHNRLRMIVAMYLSKNLWLDWRQGEAYFAENLIDWDFSANNGGWQWSASTGTDSAPYFRIFNPISQSERFDNKGEFIKAFCPELSHLDSKTIHDPHHRGATPKNYPKPLVDLKTTRAHAIEQFKGLRL